MNRFAASRCLRIAIACTIVAAVVILAHPGAGAQAPESVPKTEAAPAGNAQNGKRIFKSYGCYECHLSEGQGAPGTGPRISPPLTPLPAFVAYIRKPAGEMPPYTSRVVSDSELADMYAFLKSQPKPPAAKSILLLNN